tara:strand:+ start:503 stop:778 length:276 start_codon:yes stop_codon:yes gene_type:complete
MLKVLYQSVDDHDGWTVEYATKAAAYAGIRRQLGNVGEPESRYACADDGVCTATVLNSTLRELHAAMLSEPYLQQPMETRTEYCERMGHDM